MGQTTEDLKAQIADQRETLGQDLEAIGDRVSPARMAQRRKAAVRQGWQSTKDRVMGSAGDAGSKMSDAASSVGDAVGSVPRSAANIAEGNPLAVGLVAFGAGLVVATLLPQTQREQQLAEKVQPTVERAASEVGAAAQDTVEQLKPKAQEAVDEVKSSAQDSVQKVKDDASDAASQTTDHAKQATREVRSQ
jgi:gas vesicle protein